VGAEAGADPTCPRAAGDSAESDFEGQPRWCPPPLSFGSRRLENLSTVLPLGGESRIATRRRLGVAVPSEVWELLFEHVDVRYQATQRQLKRLNRTTPTARRIFPSPIPMI
jgi:hypothetical protein